ncbi:RNA-binding protein [Leptolyngbyaceae cyanobacterium CCMR0082]|uniref:RNA-binding protein n=1 Tax=Adonisia turfae CCMR0082 TaxID=2304604 RepID=A0A6M0S3H9_9CYAN|nr:RNA-binding protein [Adonisia turfae]MDV3351797.1 RNA-binding protein [Leptothoe sp. LEGE 181152]NEZ62956.1 RNA-binding protein [Adonisia turfae CCMR0082]
MSVRLYIGNLPRDLEREEFEAVFSEDVDNIVSVKLIADRKTGKCRGFGFVTVKTDEIADTLVTKYNGQALQDITLKVEKAMPRTKENEGTNASGGNNNRKGGKRNGGGRKPATYSSPAPESTQPDPRWASDLEKLKEMLAAQTTAS